MELNYKKIRLFWLIVFISVVIYRIVEQVIIFLKTQEIDSDYIKFISGACIALFLYYFLYLFSYKRNGVRMLVFMMSILSASIFTDFINVKFFSYFDVINVLLKSLFWFASYRLLLLNSHLSYRLNPVIPMQKGENEKELDCVSPILSNEK